MNKVCIFAAFVCICVSCTSSKKESIDLKGPDPLKVAAVSGGIVQRTSPLEVLFTYEQNTERAMPKTAFRLEPAAKGTAAWKDSHTLVFTPDEALKAGTRYTAIVDLSALSDIAPFIFNFETPIPIVDVSFEPVVIDENNQALIAGRVIADKNNDLKTIQKIIHKSELGVPTWTEQEDGYHFAFKPVERGEFIRSITISWSGNPVGAQESGLTTVLIPGTDRFEVLDIVPDGNGALEIVFSSPLRQDQDLRGFVSLAGNTNIRYALNNNIVTIFGAQDTDGIEEIPPGSELLIQDLQDINGRLLFEPVNYLIDTVWELPEVRFTGTGSILPTSQGTTLSIETRNLCGILIEAFQVYGDNMIQFLQVNEIDTTRELNRVGEPVWTHAFDLRWRETDKNRFVRHALDLSELSKKYPGTLFHIRVSFRKRHIKYDCIEPHQDFSDLEFPADDFPQFSSSTDEGYWDYVDSNRWTYNWYKYRFDPCHPAFYADYSDHSITVSRNVLVSDLGLLAKKNRDGTVFVSATNLKTAEKAPEVNISLINYQGKVLTKAQTGADGSVMLPDPGAASTIFIAAESSLGTAYLKINDSSSLSSSHFDVSGSAPLNSLRGLIYGERDVWRPGDELYLTFLLFDPAQSLPPDHPVLFELEDPRGRISITQTFTESLDGFYPITVSTAPTDPTGDWIARVKVGGSIYTKTLKVETVIPNRLKMLLDFGEKDFLDTNPTPSSLEASWLYGAPAPALRSEIQVSFSKKPASFPAYPDFSFSNPSRTVSGAGTRQTVFAGDLNDQGKASFTLKLNAGSHLPGILNAHFYTRVFEKTGAFSSEQVTKDFSPYKQYIGIRVPRGDAARNMLLTDTDHTVDIIILDVQGKPVMEHTPLTCEVYKLSWRWWWEKAEYEERSEFTTAMEHAPVYRTKIQAQGGKASWKFRVDYPGWGRYMVVVSDGTKGGGHSAASIVYIDWPSWAGRSTDSGQTGQSVLNLSTNKDSYQSGEKVAVSFPSHAQAQALVVIEKSGQILARDWIECQGENTLYEFTADPAMTPNVYVHITLLQPHLQTINDLPLRLYGIVPVMIDDPLTHLVPLIETDTHWEAESKASFSIREQSGRPMTYTVVLVDEGLLGLTRYTLSDPHKTFYAKEASFLKSWDMFSDVFGAYSGQLETLLAIGGGDDGIANETGKTERWKPVVKYFGPVQLGPGESRTESFDLPPYVGALRIMVLAASPQHVVGSRAFGTAEHSVTVSSDLMVFATVPRVLSGGDEALIPVSVYSYRSGKRTVDLSLEVQGATLIGPAQSTVSFDQPGELIVNYRIKASHEPGTAITLTARAASTGLKPALQKTALVVRNTATPVTVTQMRLLEAGATWSGLMALPGRAGTNEAILELSRMPPLNLEERLDFLITYPHGCVEQTTSAVFPQLYLERIQNLDTARIAAIRENIRDGIERLKSFQTADGGFSYWPGETESHTWGSSYAGHFLIEARRAGYALPSGMLEKWMKYQRQSAAAWRSLTEESALLDQSYRLYTLALSGNADIGSMNRLREYDMTLQASWRLAAAYWLAGQRNIAQSMTKNLSTVLVSYRELNGTFGSSLRDTAMIVETLGLLGQSAKVQPLIESIAETLSSDSWLSTQETAYALIAVCSVFKADGTTAAVAYRLGNQSDKLSFSEPLVQVKVGFLESGEFRITNTAESPLYARVLYKGIPAEGHEPELSTGLSLNVSYLNDAGLAVNPDTLAAGEDMEIRITVQNNLNRAVPGIALVCPFPASWEIVNTLMDGRRSGGNTAAQYKDIRDDRVLIYFDLNQRQQKTFSFIVNKAYGGTFFRPAIQTYAMYDESIRALVPGYTP
ncbi:MAG: alpha-2-macroglobulin [Spirochaetaceae bacterium]|jgi:uncharacterized protein YfaS (alpha-2-macroglobulin family)|nr:alpha-2-macroglobulin [Spirochaetaceae bacterium]